MILMLKKMQAGRELARRALDCKPLLAVLHPDNGTGYPSTTEIGKSPLPGGRVLPRLGSRTRWISLLRLENVLRRVATEHQFLQHLLVSRVQRVLLLGGFRLFGQGDQRAFHAGF